MSPSAGKNDSSASSDSVMSVGVPKTVVVLNAIWMIESVALLFMDQVAPNVLGIAFIIAQALVVGVLAELEVVGLRNSAASVA